MTRKQTLKEIKRKAVHNLQGGYIDEDTFNRRKSKGLYPNQTYAQYIEAEQAQRSRIDNELQALDQTNKAYQELYAENPELEDVRTNLDANGNPSSGEVVSRAESARRKKLASDRLFEAHPMGKVVKTLTDVADAAVDLPFVPSVAKQAYKALGPKTSKFYADNNLLKGLGLEAYIEEKLKSHIYLSNR